MKQEFTAILKKPEGIDSLYIEIPFDVKKTYGANRVKVKAWFDGIPYRGSIVKMGLPCHLIGINKEIRQKLGKSAGDAVSVELEKDEEERLAEIPEDFKAALEKNHGTASLFEKLSYSRKREYISWIESAKKAETRNSRIEKAVQKLLE